MGSCNKSEQTLELSISLFKKSWHLMCQSYLGQLHAELTNCETFLVWTKRTSSSTNFGLKCNHLFFIAELIPAAEPLWCYRIQALYHQYVTGVCFYLRSKPVDTWYFPRSCIDQVILVPHKWLCHSDGGESSFQFSLEHTVQKVLQN